MCTCICIRTFSLIICLFNYRYSVTCEFGQGHQVLGKVSRLPPLTSEERIQLEEYNIAYSTVKHYHRVILKGTLYSSTSYITHSQVKNDSAVLLHHDGHSYLGAIKDCLSFCRTNCIACTQLCQHVVIILLYTILPNRIGHDDLTGATAAQIFHCSLTRFSYFTTAIIYILICIILGTLKCLA